MGLLRETMTRKALAAIRVVTATSFDAELVMMQLIALEFGRHIAELPKLSGVDISEIAERVGPMLDANLLRRV